jgi:1D-myo-inositol-triphosphate 3-kinase
MVEQVGAYQEDPASPATSSAAKGKVVLQAAGHAGTFCEDADDVSFVLKPYDDQEAINYASLWGGTMDPIQRFVAPWGGTTEVRVGSESTGESRLYMRIGNLLQRFHRPCVMDCKLGLRTFQEKEAAGSKPREDLFLKLEKFMPEAITEEENRNRAITKLKWMSTRDAASTSSSLGFRVDGIVSEEGTRIDKEQLSKLSNQQQVLQVLPRLLPLSASGRASVSNQDAANRDRTVLIREIIAELEKLRTAMETSDFVRSHEFVGASVLTVVDKNMAGVHLIDFAKTEAVPKGTAIDHRKAWELGNHEDGLLYGMEKLIECWRTTLGYMGGGTVSQSMPDASYFQDAWQQRGMDELDKKLKAHGVDVKQFGTGSTKSLDELFSEVYMEKTVSLEKQEDGRLFRVMDVVCAWIIVDLGDDEKFVLMEPKSRQQKSLLSAKGGSAGSMTEKPFRKKMVAGQSWEDALRDALEGRLGLEPKVQDENLDVVMKTYKKDIVTKEGTNDHGYVGLWSMYRVHEIDVRIKNPYSATLTLFGLPGGVPFTTMEKEGEHDAFGHRTHSWKWRPLSETRLQAIEPTSWWACSCSGNTS